MVQNAAKKIRRCFSRGLFKSPYFVALSTLWAIAALLPGLPAGWLIGNTMRRGYKSDEPSLALLIAAASPRDRNSILNLQEFCNRAASGKFGVVERYPDGSVRELSSDLLKCFAANGGKMLVLSADPANWLLIRRRPVPRGEILIDIRGSVASTELTSKTRIDLEDVERFNALKVAALAKLKPLSPIKARSLNPRISSPHPGCIMTHNQPEKIIGQPSFGDRRSSRAKLTQRFHEGREPPP